MSVPTLPSTADPLAVTIQTIIDELAEIFVERRPTIEALWLAILSKSNAFILGPPGTAKTQLVRHIFNRILEKVYFEVQMSRFMPPEVLLGPTDLKRLRETGDLVHKVDGYLPTANFANVDELWKMNESTGHSLLTIALDHVLHQVQDGQADSWIECPLYTMIGGSNELPDGDNQEAMYDRTLIRTVVDVIKEPGNFVKMVHTDLSLPPKTTVDFADLANVIDNVIPTIPIPPDVDEAVLRLRDALAREDIIPSDRRWHQNYRLLQAAAWLRGAAQVEPDDVQVLRYSLWELPHQLVTVERACLSVANPLAEKAMELLDVVEEIARRIRELKGQSQETRAAYGIEASGKIKLLQTDLATYKQEALAAGRSTTKLDEVGDRIMGVKRSVYVELMGLEKDAV